MKFYRTALLLACLGSLVTTSLAADSRLKTKNSASTVSGPAKKKSNASLPRPTAIDPADLTAEQLELASQVLVGRIDCALGESVTITPDVPVPGKFLLETAQAHYIMHPVASRTGAIRLESNWAGAVWIQVANKSMLVSDLDGSRLADDCIAPQQAIAAQAMAATPSLLD